MDVEMLSQEHCSKCEEAKQILKGRGFTIIEFDQLALFERDDRAEVMAALAENDGRYPVMRLKGGCRWMGSVQEILQEAQQLRENAKGKREPFNLTNLFERKPSMTETQNPYLRAAEMMEHHPTTGGSYALAKAILSLYSDENCYSIRECLDGRDADITRVIVEMVAHYAQRGEDQTLRMAGKKACQMYPHLLEIGYAGYLAKNQASEHPCQSVASLQELPKKAGVSVDESLLREIAGAATLDDSEEALAQVQGLTRKGLARCREARANRDSGR